MDQIGLGTKEKFTLSKGKLVLGTVKEILRTRYKASTDFEKHKRHDLSFSIVVTVACGIIVEIRIAIDAVLG